MPFLGTKRFLRKLFTCNVNDFKPYNMKKSYIHTRQKGNKAKDIACLFVKNKGFGVIERNYQKKWGEIDIIARKINKNDSLFSDNITHFFEVKSSFSYTNFNKYRPEENVHNLKVRHIRSMIQTFMHENNLLKEGKFQFHVLVVHMNLSTHLAKVEWLQDIIL